MNAIQVVYIEDEQDEATLFRLGLARRGIEVLHLPDAMPKSLKLLKSPPYQTALAVFFDLWVSGMNGLDLGRSLRADGDNRPFFLVTAGTNPNPSLLNELHITYLPKPLNFGRVADLVLALARQ